MNQEIVDYIKTERVGVIAIDLPEAGPHGATVHFAASENPFVFYFQTFKDSIKARGFVNGETCQATFVIGTDESKMKTFQLDGVIELVKSEEKEACEKIYLGKFPEKAERAKDPRAVYFIFTPTWWRYSDFKHSDGKLVLTSAE